MGSVILRVLWSESLLLSSGNVQDMLNALSFLLYWIFGIKRKDKFGLMNQVQFRHAFIDRFEV